MSVCNSRHSWTIFSSTKAGKIYKWNWFCTEIHHPEKASNGVAFLLSSLSIYVGELTFHTEFGASSILVDENKKNEEEDTSEAR